MGKAGPKCTKLLFLAGAGFVARRRQLAEKGDGEREGGREGEDLPQTKFPISSPSTKWTHWVRDNPGKVRQPGCRRIILHNMEERHGVKSMSGCVKERLGN